MTIEQIKTIFTAGMQAVKQSDMKVICKHDRKKDANFMAENDDFMVSFSGPLTSVSYDNHGNRVVRKELCDVTIYDKHSDREGTKLFAYPKCAIRFLRLAVSNPKVASKRMEMYCV